ncbi:MAG: carbonate dehydratase [Calditrichia bacterium]
MSDRIDQLLENNKQWAQSIKKQYPDFFKNLSGIQQPNYLWIGCSDSRVPANQILDLMPGEVFVHRNIANQAIHTDLNFLSVLQYAVEALKIDHILVCGHYNCGGVKAALEDEEHGLIDNWLEHIRDIYLENKSRIDHIHSPEQKVNYLCELNVFRQIDNISRTTIVKNALKQGRNIQIHGLIYSLEDGLLNKLV